MTEEVKTILSSMTPEQYKKYFSNLAVLPISLKNNKEEYINLLSSGNEVVELLLESFYNNNIYPISTSIEDGSYKIRLLVNPEGIGFIKFIRDYISQDDCKITYRNSSNIHDIEMNMLDLNTVINVKTLMDNLPEEVQKTITGTYSTYNDYILNEYPVIPEGIINELKQENDFFINYLKEKEEGMIVKRIVGNLAIDENLENSVSISKVHSLDPVYKRVAYQELTDDMKQVMCNKFFMRVMSIRLEALRRILSNNHRFKFDIHYNFQTQENLPSYGITGKLRPIESLITNAIEISMYPNIDYCTIKNDVATINSELLGELMIAIIHEESHLNQQMCILLDERDKLIDDICLFEEQCNKNPEFLEKYYKYNPAEISATIYSYIGAKKIASMIGINDIEATIVKRVNDNYKNADENHRLYENEFTSYDDVISYLASKLISIDIQSLVSNYKKY